MSLISFLKKTISDFRGAWLVQEQTAQLASRASLSQNMRVLPGKTFTRPGLGLLVSLGIGAIRTFYNQFTIYLTVEYSRILYLEAPDQII